MIQIRRSAIVRHSAEQMYALVNDVEAYPQHFSWCAGASVLQRDTTTVNAKLELKLVGLSQSFTTRNTLDAPNSIHLQLVEGPFRALSGDWTFTTLGPDGCKVALALDFDYAGGLLAPVMRLGFQKLADRLVDEFCSVADRIYV